MFDKKPVSLIIFLLSLASRIPALIRPELVLDGDECVLATMAKHAYQAKELPIYFWGQNYGFSLIEILFVLPFYAVIGINTLSVKLGMAVLWSLGNVFFYKTLTGINKENKALAIILTLILITTPAWAEWSIKARGGYITAFTLSNLSTYILFQLNIRRYFKYPILGILIATIYKSQAFWLCGLIPLVAYHIIQEKKYLHLATVIVSVLLMSLILASFHYQGYIVFATNNNGFSSDFHLERLFRFPEYLYKSVQGNYFLAWYQDTRFFHKLFSKVFVLMVGILSLSGILHLLFNRKGFGLFIVSTLFIPLTICYSILPEDMQGRYMLPVTGYALLSLFIYTQRLRIETFVKVATAATLALSMGTVIFPVYFNGQTNKKELLESIAHLKKNGVKYVYATNCMLPWEYVFYSNEEIKGRMFYFPGRYPQYDTLVDKALYSRERTAVVGYWRDYAGLDIDSIAIETHYFI
ncbi:MAG: hypothetical protein KDC11_00005, partial [Chitinophagaceae bacterium]|nr:hypothetical protein [Chitinophagaceae bacterium]